MAYKFNLGTYKVGGTIDMSAATDVVHKDGTVDNADLAGSIANDKLAGGITANKINFADGLRNDGGTLKLKFSGSTGIEANADGLRIKVGTGLQVDGGGMLKVNEGGVNINNLNNAGQKANSNVSLTAGDGLTGGGDLTTNRTFSIDLHGDTGLGLSADGLKIKTSAGHGLETDGGGNLKVKIGSGMHLDGTNGLELAATIGGNRTFSNDVIVNGNIDTDNDATTLFASCENNITIGGNSSTVIINGDLQVDGTLERRSATEIQIEDLTLQLAQGAADGPAANGAGLKIDGADAFLTWDNGNSRMNLNQTLAATGFVGSGAGLTNLPSPPSINLANEGGDSTCFLVFSQAATGNQALKTNADLKFAADTGTLEANEFRGDFRLQSKVKAPAMAINASGGSAPAWSSNAYTLDTNSIKNYYVYSNSHAANDQFNLTAKAGQDGRMLIFKNGHASNAMRIAPNGSEKIEGANAHITLEAGGAVTLVCIENGGMAGWWIH